MHPTHLTTLSSLNFIQKVLSLGFQYFFNIALWSVRDHRRPRHQKQEPSGTVLRRRPPP